MTKNNTDSTNRNKGDTKSSEGFRTGQFPFQTTPSGHLKVIPQQVAFESHKLSVLVADPNQTRVKIDKMQATNQDTETKKLSASGRLGSFSMPGAPGLPIHIMASNPAKYNSMLRRPSPDQWSYSPTEPHEEEEQFSEDSGSVSSELNLSRFKSAPIDWAKVKMPQKMSLYKHMHYRITNFINPDCLVQIEDVQFNCHLLVLQCYSTYFNEKTAREMVKLPSDSVTPGAFELIYEWMTSVQGDSHTILTRDNILEVFVAAQYLGIKELEEQCWAFVDSEELFIEDTAFLLYLEAKKTGNNAVMELMLPRIMRFFLPLVSSREYLEIEPDEINIILSSNYITVHSEFEVFMSAVRWLRHDWKNRKEYLHQVMSCVRFGLISPWQLVDIRRNPENKEFLDITSDRIVQQMIDLGQSFATIKYWYGDKTNDFYHWIDVLGLSEPPDRNWIVSEEKNYVTYREFLSDLSKYRKALVEDKEVTSDKSSKPKETETEVTSSRRDTRETQRSASRRSQRGGSKTDKVPTRS